MAPKVRHLSRAWLTVATVTGLILSSLLVFGQTKQCDSFRPTAETYAELTRHLMEQYLSVYSGPPPLLDLSKPDRDVPGAGKKWEDFYSNTMMMTPILDLGTRTRDEATSMVVATIDFVGPDPLIFGKSCPLVATATPIKASAHMSYNGRLVYSTFEVQLLQVFKGASEKRRLQGGNRDRRAMGRSRTVSFRSSSRC
jgi:hypothetical protein